MAGLGVSLKVHAGDLYAALVTAVGFQIEVEKDRDRKSKFLQNIEKMVEAMKVGKNLEIKWPDDLNELG